MKPLLSVVIPTYNSASTIEAALKSCLCQTFKDFEIVVIDGVSRDNTLDIVSFYQRKGLFIKVICEPDKGIYDAMNKGIALAEGEWIYFLGSDDSFIGCDVLNNISNSISDNLDVVYGNVVSTRFNGRYDGEFTIKKIYHQNICHQSIFFRKSVFNKIGTFNLKYAAHADWDSNMKWVINKGIRKKYLAIDIANYADGGFSSTIEGGCDKVFEIDRDINFLSCCLNAPKDTFVTMYSLQHLKDGFSKHKWSLFLLSFKVLIKQKLTLSNLS